MRKIKEISIKVLRLILVFVMIALIIPMNIVASAEDDDPKSAIGSVVSLISDTYAHKVPGDRSAMQGLFKSEVPEYLVVLDVAEISTQVWYQLGTMDGSEHSVLSEFSWVESRYVKIVEIPVNKEGMIEGQVGLVVDGKSVSEITVERGKKRYVSTSLGKLVMGTPTYQWQLLIDKANNRWADVSGYCQPYANISEALLINAFDEEGKATIRCVATVGKNKYVSDNMTVTMVEPTAGSDQGISYENGHIQGLPPLQSAVKPLKEPLQEPRAVDAFQVTIQYLYRHDTAVKPLDGTEAAPAFVVSLPAGGHYTGTVTSSPVIGYLPYVLEEDLVEGKVYIQNKENSITYGEAGEEKTYYPANVLNFNGVGGQTQVRVYYIPQKVNFMVKIYEQNLHNDEYVLADTVLYPEKLADEAVGEGLDLPRTGFSALYYDPEIPINGEGTTEIEIYYDRNYYLVNFDLKSDDAYGATPYYVRYNTQVALPKPTRPGYTFTGWNLESVYTIEYKIEEGEEKEEIKQVEDANIRDLYDKKDANMLITVQHNAKYSANWAASNASYTVIYWRENENDNEFSIWKTETVSGVTAGSVVDVSGRDISSDEKTYFTRNDALSDKTVTVKGDGTSAANIYYTRNIYYIIFQGTDAQGAKTCRIAAHTHGTGTGCCSVEGCDHTNGTCQIEMYCTLEAHTHEAACNVKLVCEVAVHAEHNNDCRDCGQEEHRTHNNACRICGKNEHTHTRTCYADQKNFTTINNITGNQRNAYNNLIANISTPINGYVYRARRSADNDTNYNFFYIGNTWYYLNTNNNYQGVTFSGTIAEPSFNNPTYVQATVPNNRCKQEEHTHSDTCYKDKLHTHSNACYHHALHVHTDACYTNTCGRVAHTHEAGCYQACIRYEHTTHNTRYLYVIAAKYNADVAAIWPTETQVAEWRTKGWLNNNVYYQYWNVTSGTTTSTNNMWATKRVDMTTDLCSTDANKTLTLTLVSDDSPGRYTVQYMFESLEQTAGGNREYYSGRYYEADPRYTQDGLYNNSYSPKAILGMTALNNDSGLKLYYTRNSYNLVFMNGGATDKTVSLKYETPLQSQEYTPNLPSWYEANSVRFAGWYTTQICADGTEFNFTASIMPAHNIYLYAKWTPCFYTAKVYLDSEKDEENGLLSTQTLVFNSPIVEPDYKAAQAGNVEYRNLIFAGWYYMDGATEKRFDFNTMVLKGHIEIYAKWTSHVPVDYTVYYVIEDENGNYVEIADPTKGQSLAGITKSFTAKVGTDLYNTYQTGYFPQKRTASILMSNTEANVAYFIYGEAQPFDYFIVHNLVSEKFTSILGRDTLQLKEDFPAQVGDGDVVDIEITFHEGFTKAGIIAKAEEIKGSTLNTTQVEAVWTIVTGLSPDHYKQTLILSTDDTNEIVFNWIDRDQISTYQVIHYFEAKTGQYVAEYTQSFVGNIGDPVEAAVIDRVGFVEDKSEPKRVPEGNISGLTFDKDGKPNGGLVLKRYYKRATYTYTVHHYVQGTATKLHEDETFSAKFEDVVSVASKAKTIAGYALANGATEYEITREGQEIFVYYKGLDVYYNYQISGATLGGWFSLDELIVAQQVVHVGEAPKGLVFTLLPGYVLKGWFYVISGKATEIVMPDDHPWLSTVDGKIVIQPEAASAEWATKTITIYAKVEPTSLTIQNSGQLSDPEQAIIYEVSDGNGNLLLTVAVVGQNGSVTILGLPLDANYTITVKDDWSWEYKGPANAPTQTQMQTIPSFDGDETLTFEFQGIEDNSSITDDAYGE